MIKRLISLLFLAWVLGFAWFALLLPQPAPAEKTDAIVVLTGGPGRIDRALERLEEKAKLTQTFLDDLRENPHPIEYVDFSYESPFIKLRQ